MSAAPQVVETQQVVLGPRRYAVLRDWGRWPEDIPRGVVSTVAATASGDVLVARRNAPAVACFTADGHWKGTWGEAGVCDPHGINVDSRGRVLLVDRDAHQVLICGVDGAQQMSLGTRHRPSFQAPFNHPTSAFAAADGEIYVADGYGNACVHRFAADGRHLATWGSPGRGDGEFSTPHSVWVDRRDRVLVVDRENDRVQVFDREGGFVEAWGGFNRPMDLCEDAEGNVYVTDQTPRLSLLSPDGELIGRCRPVWNVPHGLALCADGAIVLTEMNPNSLTRLEPVVG